MRESSCEPHACSSGSPSGSLGMPPRATLEDLIPKSAVRPGGRTEESRANNPVYYNPVYKNLLDP